MDLHHLIRDYNGNADTFEGWKRDTQVILHRSKLNETEKLDCVTLKLIGDAKLLQMDKIQTTEELFTALAKSFVRNANRILADCKQKDKELVRVFSMRLKACLNTRRYRVDFANIL